MLIDGPTVLPDARHTVIPHTVIHQCVEHLARQRLQNLMSKVLTTVASVFGAIY